MKPGHLMLLSLPNSGSTWFAECLARAHAGRYFFEYFNPFQNPKRELVLNRSFGCESIAGYRNIASPGSIGIHDEIRQTWGQDGYTFTKEVFSPLKLPVFAEHFKCVVFLREEELTFPPTRGRIISFYEHAWWALQESPFVSFRPAPRGETAFERAHEAYRLLMTTLQSAAKALDVPVLDYRQLFLPEAEVQSLLADTFGNLIDPKAASRAIGETGRMKERA